MLRLLPILGGFGALIPIAGLLLVRLLVDASASPAAAQQVEMLDFRVMVVTVIYWSVFVTLALGFTVAWALRRGKSVLFAPPRKG